MRFRLVGSPAPAPTAPEIRKLILGQLGWRWQPLRAVNGDGKLRLTGFVATGDPEQDAYAELLARARLPLGFEPAEDDPVAVDVEQEKAVEAQVEADRQLRLEAAREHRVERERGDAAVFTRHVAIRLAARRRRRRQLAAAAEPSPRLRARLGRR
ncbi:MAG: hypothetical protein ACJ75L_10530 [Gaiellaceae bacterium]